MMKIMNKRNKSITGQQAGFALVAALWAGAVSAFVMMGSSLNPWSKVLPALDSAVFLRCGVEMVQGKTMYVDMWDHKGPILFLIQYLGLSLTPNSLDGLWGLEVLFCMVTFFAFYRTARLISHSRLVSLLAATLSFQPFYYFMEEGNTVEEWALPFIAISLYFFVKYLKTGVVVKGEILLTGVCMACTFLLNGNLVSVWICYVLWIMVKLIIEKRYKDLRTCILFFLIGAGVVMAIVVFVLLLQGSLGAFLEIYFGFNAEYAMGSRPFTLKSYLQLMLDSFYRDEWLMWIYLFLLIGLLHHRRWKDIRWSTFAYLAVALVVLNMSRRGYAHYNLQLIPCMIIPMASFIEAVYKWCKSKGEFIVICLLVFASWGRFRVEDYVTQKIAFTLDENSDNDMAGGDGENYIIVNQWLGGRWSQEAIEKWVIYEEYTD